MKILIDALAFLKLFLDEPGADQAQELLEAVENGNVIGYGGLGAPGPPGENSRRRTQEEGPMG